MQHHTPLGWMHKEYLSTCASFVLPELCCSCVMVFFWSGDTDFARRRLRLCAKTCASSLCLFTEDDFTGADGERENELLRLRRFCESSEHGARSKAAVARSKAGALSTDVLEFDSCTSTSESSPIELCVQSSLFKNLHPELSACSIALIGKPKESAEGVPVYCDPNSVFPLASEGASGLGLFAQYGAIAFSVATRGAACCLVCVHRAALCVSIGLMLTPEPAVECFEFKGEERIMDLFIRNACSIASIFAN